MASGKLTFDDAPEEWARAFLMHDFKGPIDFKPDTIKQIEAWFKDAIAAGYLAGVRETMQQIPVSVQPEADEIETDAEVWATEFNKFCSANNVAFEDVARWFREAITAGVKEGKLTAFGLARDPKPLEVMQHEVLKNNIAHGWMDEPYSFGDCMANLTGEVSEAWEAWRKWGLEDQTLTQERVDQHHNIGSPHGFCNHGELPGDCKEVTTKPEGVGSEFADIFIRLLDDCERYGIDLRAEYERKMAYNRTRPWRHGNKRA
jgi:NTP pyrophosphatase (non-canonical NTP hydrolase)